jgi:hypothetical protein
LDPTPWTLVYSGPYFYFESQQQPQQTQPDKPLWHPQVKLIDRGPAGVSPAHHWAWTQDFFDWGPRVPEWTYQWAITPGVIDILALCLLLLFSILFDMLVPLIFQLLFFSSLLLRPPPPLPHTHTPNVIRESTCLHTSLVGLLAVCSNFLCCQTPACRLVDLIEDWQVGKQLFSWKNEVVNTPTNVANGNCQVELNIATSQWHYTAQYPLLRSSSTLTKWVYFLKESYFVFEEFELL